MNAAEVHAAFEEHGAVRKGHFHLSSGKHSDTYLQSALLLQWPGLAERLGHELGSRFASDEPTVVLGPAMGGVIIAHEVARYLGVRMVFSERVDGVMTLRRGFGLGAQDRVLVAEDVVTTGGSQREALGLAKAGGARPVGVAAIVDRSEGVSFGVRFEALLPLQVGSWSPEECPMCRRGEELTSPGSRRLAS